MTEPAHDQPAHDQPAHDQPAHDQPAPRAEEDAKLVTLARATRLRGHAPRTGVVEGAAVRDGDGRTYAAATVENGDPALTTSALRAAVAAGVSSGARVFEAAAVVTEGLPSAADLAVLREFGVGIPVLLAAPDGTVRDTLRS